MKTGIWILTIWLAASAWAQTPAPKQSAAKPAAQQAKVHPAVPAKQTPARVAKVSAPAASRARHLHRLKSVQRPAAIRAASAGLAGHRRDPFVSPIVERTRIAASCTGAGKRCLYIGDISLRGIVESSNGILAVVVNGPHTYFLREHDPLADGEVERITSNAITLRQRSIDMLGRPVEHEVTRKIGPPAV